MSVRAKLYSVLVNLCGAAALVSLVFPWEFRNPLVYACYLAVALAFSRVSVTVPGLLVAVPLFKAFVMLAVIEFSLPEALILSGLAALVHSAGGRKVREMMLTVCTMAITVAVCYPAYHSSSLVLGASMSFMLFYAIDTFGTSVVSCICANKPLLRVWRESYALYFPLYLISGALAGVMAVLTRKAGWQSGIFVVPVFYSAYRALMAIRALVVDRKTAQQRTMLHLQTIEALAMAIEAKDNAGPDHLRRVQLYSLEVGKELGLSELELEALRAAALLHDIGKLAVPDHILSKPGKLSREEFEKMKIHPTVGAEILERVGFPYPVIPIVRHHHEKWNGSGYPKGLKGSDIPIGARILAAVDCLDALASDRQYRRASALEDAMRKVASDSGTSFDPQVVEILQRRCLELEVLVMKQRDARVPLTAGIPIGRSFEPTTGLTSIASASQEVQTLFEFAQDLGNSLSLNETLSLVAHRLKRIIPYDTLAIYVPHQDDLRPEYVTGDQSRLFSALTIPLGQGLSGWVGQSRKSIINGDPAAEPGYLAGDLKFTPMRSALSQPLLTLNGLTGVLTMYRWEKDAFTQDHLRLTKSVSPKVALAIENALKYQQAESSAATDFMTGLPNARSLFLHLDGELARCRRTGSPLVVMVCDLNGFKQVNDKFGHLEGNNLLHAVADKLKESCREYDYVARMGGDEFVLIFPGLTLDQVHLKTSKLNLLTKEAGREVCGVETLGLSIGHSCYPEDGTDAEQLLSEADRRMYVVKQKEKLRVVQPRGFDFDELASSRR